MSRYCKVLSGSSISNRDGVSSRSSRSGASRTRQRAPGEYFYVKRQVELRAANVTLVQSDLLRTGSKDRTEGPTCNVSLRLSSRGAPLEPRKWTLGYGRIG